MLKPVSVRNGFFLVIILGNYIDNGNQFKIYYKLHNKTMNVALFDCCLHHNKHLNL
jgi:hypothetical protein